MTTAVKDSPALSAEDAARLLRAAIITLLDTPMPERFEHPDIIAGFQALARELASQINTTREEELALLRELAKCVPPVVTKLRPTAGAFADLEGHYKEWNTLFGPDAPA